MARTGKIGTIPTTTASGIEVQSTKTRTGWTEEDLATFRRSTSPDSTTTREGILWALVTGKELLVLQFFLSLKINGIFAIK